MYIIQANKSGSRSIEITDSQLLTLFRYNLLQGFPGSHGVVDESDLEKLRYTVRSLIVSQDDDESRASESSAEAPPHPSPQGRELSPPSGESEGAPLPSRDGGKDAKRLSVTETRTKVNGTRELLDLFADVLCHPNMKAFGLNELIKLYNNWSEPE